MNLNKLHTLGIDIGSTTVKIAILDSENEVLFSDYERHFANIQETLSDLLGRALYKLGSIQVSPVITGSGGLTLAKHLGVPFVQEVIAVSTALQDYAPVSYTHLDVYKRQPFIPCFRRWNRCADWIYRRSCFYCCFYCCFFFCPCLTS